MLYVVIAIAGVVLLAAGFVGWRAFKRREILLLSRQVKHVAKDIPVSETGKLPPIDAAAHGFKQVRGENLLAVHNWVTRHDFKSFGRYSTEGSAGKKDRAARVRFAPGKIAGRSELQPAGQGRLWVTDRAVVFQTSSKTRRWNWGEIRDVEVVEDGYVFHFRQAAPVLLTWHEPEIYACAIMQVLLARTLQSAP